jgi:hypothetical protein
VRGPPVDKVESFIALIAQLDSLPVAPPDNVDALLSAAAENAPLPPQFTFTRLTPQQQQQQQQQQQAAGDDAAAAADGALCDDDYAAFLVDDDDLAAVGLAGAAAAGGGGADGFATRKRLLSRVGAGVSSASLDLRQLSDVLTGGSSSALLQSSLWHKVCRNVSFSRDRRSGAAAAAAAHRTTGDAGASSTGVVSSPAPRAAAAGVAVPPRARDEDEDAGLGLRDMSIT